jgi:hypothetical protein
MSEYLLLDLRRDRFRMWPASATALLDEGVTHQEGAADLVERVAEVTHDLAGTGDVAEFIGQLQQGKLSSQIVH